MGRPVTQEDHDRVRELHAQGLSRNAIAAAMGRSGRTVSRIAARLGLTFDREQVRAATEAKKADARARRAALALALLDDVDQLRARLHVPYVVYQFDREGNLVTGVLAQPPARDQRDLMMAIGAAIDRSLRLDEYDADPGLDAAKSMLGALARGLGAAYDQLNQHDGD
jgi:hypothetical protein